jgi:hypothetical protein
METQHEAVAGTIVSVRVFAGGAVKAGDPIAIVRP